MRMTTTELTDSRDMRKPDPPREGVMAPDDAPENRSRLAGATSMAALLLLAASAYAAYFVLRFGGLWAENDSAVFSAVSTSTVSSGSVLFAHQYPHGFGYSAWLSTVSLLTGLSPPFVNGIVAPFCGAWFLVLGAFVAYRSLLHSMKAAVTAILFLLATPDLMFSVLRGNHEKLNIVLLLASLFCLAKGFQALRGANRSGFYRWMVVLLLLCFANSTIHDYATASFLFALTIAIPLVQLHSFLSPKAQGIMQSGRAMVRRPSERRWVTRRRRRQQPPRSNASIAWHLSLVTALSWAVLVMVMLVIFRPESNDLLLTGTVMSHLLSMFTAHHATSNPYSAPAAQWIDPVVLIGLALFRWILILGSFLAWGWKSWTFFVHRQERSFEGLLLGSLYGAFGVLVVASIPIDFSGVSFGSNFELRNFTALALVAAPLLSSAVTRFVWPARLRSSRHSLPGQSHARFRGLTIVHTVSSRRVAGVAMATLLAVGLLKATLEPLVSNHWMFYSMAERQALSGFLSHTTQQRLWSGPDNRLTSVVQNWSMADPGGSEVYGYGIQRQDTFFLFSPAVSANLVAQKRDGPPYSEEDRVYAIGSAALYARAHAGRSDR